MIGPRRSVPQREHSLLLSLSPLPTRASLPCDGDATGRELARARGAGRRARVSLRAIWSHEAGYADRVEVIAGADRAAPRA